MSKLEPLVLSVKRGRFRFDDPNANASDAAFKQIRPQILRRDKFTCCFCGFRAPKYQEVHHRNDDHDENTEQNLVTACVLCHMTHHIGFAGQKQRGCLIYLDPEIGCTQAGLNNLVRGLWIGARSREKEVQVHSISLLSRMLKASVSARRMIGTSDATVLGDYLLGLPDREYARRAEALSGIYLLPLKEGYEKHIEYWDKGVFNSIPARTWPQLAEKKHALWGSLGDE